MNKLKILYRSFLVLVLVVVSACDDRLTEMNENPNGIDPSNANPNLMMPTVMTSAATRYLDLGFSDVAGVMQHTQKTGWYTAHNVYDWAPQDWTPWYELLRTSNLIHDRSVALNWKFHQGVALTMKSFIFGMITDLWGDAPYTNAVKGNLGSDFALPAFDSQELIYTGIIEDLKKASDLFATGDATGVIANYDVYYGGNVERWQKFVNSLLLRYYMRISEKKPDVARAGIETVYNSGIYIKSASEDAVMGFVGTTSVNSWPTGPFDDGSNYRNRKPATTLLARLTAYNDPRLTVWFSPARVKWVADPALPTAVDEFIRKDGVIQNGVTNLTDQQYQANPGNYTRHFNPTLPQAEPIIAGDYVGIPPGILLPDDYNGNPTPGQVLQNQHVSQLADIYRNATGPLLKARLISAAETYFILAEAATVKGWSVGDGQAHYNAAIQNSLTTWGVADKYNAYITTPGVAFTGTLEQIIEQKWIASWTAATEAWFDFRRTGLPALQPGPASPETVLPVRFIYGDNETLLNASNAEEAIGRLKATPYSNLRGKNSQWSKSWIIDGTNKPW